MTKVKKLFLLTLAVVFALTFSIAFVGCGKEEYTLSVTNDTIEIKATDTADTVDFMAGVKGTLNGEDAEVKLDSSNVVFGTAGGSYKITYTCGTETKEATVKIYGTPVFSGEKDLSVAWAEQIDLNNTGLKAEDSFGTALTITVEGKLNRDEYGRIAYGEHDVKYKCTDKLGNSAEENGKLTVTGQPFLQDITTDLADPDVSYPLGSKEVVALRLGGEVVASDNYEIVDGNFSLKPIYIATLTVGENLFDVQFKDGYCDCKVIVTDNQNSTLVLPESIFEEVVADTAVKLPVVSGTTYQKLEVKYYLDNAIITDLNVTFTDEQAASNPHIYKIEVVRNNEVIDSKEYSFNVIDKATFYSKPIEGAEMAKIFIPAAPESSGNKIEWNEEKKYFEFTENTNNDNQRGFTIDMDYLHNVIKYSDAIGIKITFGDFATTEGTQMFVSRSTDKDGSGWWESDGWDIAKNPKAVEKTWDWFTDGETKYTLWMLNTVGGFTASFTLLYPEKIEVLATYDMNGVEANFADIDIGGLATCTSKEIVAEGYPEGGTGSALKITENGIYRGVTVNIGTPFEMADTAKKKIVMRMYIDGSATQKLWLYNLNWAKAGGDGNDAVVQVEAGKWVDVAFEAEKFVIDGKFTGFKWANFTGGPTAVYIDSISIFHITN